MLSRPPGKALKPFIRQLWVHHGGEAAVPGREHVLPTGQAHLVFRLAGPALRIYADAGDGQGRVWREPVLGGPRNSFYIKETGLPVHSVGVQLEAGAVQALFGVSAAELADRHTPLSELCGAQGESIWQQLAEAGNAPRQLAVLEGWLAARLPRVRGLHPGVAQILGSMTHESRVEELVRASRYSHRGFNALFKQATGFSPKRYARLLRFQALLAAMREQPQTALSELALALGYSDQAHMNREFREFAGLTPLQYRLLAPEAANHVRPDCYRKEF